MKRAYDVRPCACRAPPRHMCQRKEYYIETSTHEKRETTRPEEKTEDTEANIP